MKNSYFDKISNNVDDLLEFLKLAMTDLPLAKSRFAGLTFYVKLGPSKLIAEPVNRDYHVPLHCAYEDVESSHNFMKISALDIREIDRTNRIILNLHSAPIILYTSDKLRFHLGMSYHKICKFFGSLIYRSKKCYTRGECNVLMNPNFKIRIIFVLCIRSLKLPRPVKRQLINCLRF